MKKIVLFGDSIFNGFRNHQNTDLVTNLFKHSLGNNIEIQNISKSGATTVEGLDYLKQIPNDIDLTIIEYGTNDAATAWGISLENYAKNLQKMVSYLNAKCIIVGPMLPDPNNSEISQFYPNLQQFNKKAQQIAQANHLPFIDMTQAFANLPNISSYYQNDGQHLTDKGNELLVKTITPAILINLKD